MNVMISMKRERKSAQLHMKLQVGIYEINTLSIAIGDSRIGRNYL